MTRRYRLQDAGAGFRVIDRDTSEVLLPATPWPPEARSTEQRLQMVFRKVLARLGALGTREPKVGSVDLDYEEVTRPNEGP